jgi:ribosomal protein L7/L12
MTYPEYFLAFLLVASAIAAFFRQIQRLQDVERKLNLVLAHLGVEPTAAVPPSSLVIRLARDPQQRIAAIKAYREQTGAGLKEAAAVIEKIAAGARASQSLDRENDVIE